MRYDYDAYKIDKGQSVQLSESEMVKAVFESTTFFVLPDEWSELTKMGRFKGN